MKKPSAIEPLEMPDLFICTVCGEPGLKMMEGEGDLHVGFGHIDGNLALWRQCFLPAAMDVPYLKRFIESEGREA